jgi:competence protein ComEA
MAYALFRAWDDRTAPPIIIEDAAAVLPVVVEVRGAVQVSGVFELPPDARVQDAVAAAGGLSSDADFASVNLARRLRDGEVIAIPARSIPGASGAASANEPGETTDNTSAHLININTASVAELEELPGIGVVTAERIIEFRDENGPYRSVDDLVAIEGISSRTIDGFRDLVTTGP